MCMCFIATVQHHVSAVYMLYTLIYHTMTSLWLQGLLFTTLFTTLYSHSYIELQSTKLLTKGPDKRGMWSDR